MKRYTDRIYTIFPFERDYFRSKGIEPTYSRNPLVDDFAQMRSSLPTWKEFLEQNGLDSRPIIALLAGSRISEIDANLPDMVALSRRFSEYQFVVTAVPWIDRSVYDKYIASSSVR